MSARAPRRRESAGAKFEPHRCFLLPPPTSTTHSTHDYLPKMYVRLICWSKVSLMAMSELSQHAHL